MLSGSAPEQIEMNGLEAAKAVPNPVLPVAPRVTGPLPTQGSKVPGTTATTRVVDSHPFGKESMFCWNRTNCNWKWVLLWTILSVLLCLLLGILIYFLTPRVSLEQKRSTFSRNKTDSRTFGSSNLLLDDAVQPRSYELELQTFHCLDATDYDNNSNDGQDCRDSFRGSVQIRLFCSRTAAVLQLHALQLKFNASNILVTHSASNILADIGSSNETGFQDAEIRLSAEPKFERGSATVRLELSRPLQPGRMYTLTISNYTGIIHRTSGKGLYLSRYRTKQNQTRLLASTQFEVAHARQVFPCFDEPRFKATYSITIIRRANMRSLSNTVRVKSVNRGNGWVADSYATSIKMSTYLVAFVVGDLHYREAQSRRKIKVRTFCRPDAIGDVEHALRIAVKMLDYCEQFFGTEYPMRKLGCAWFEEVIPATWYFCDSLEKLFSPKHNATRRRYSEEEPERFRQIAPYFGTFLKYKSSIELRNFKLIKQNHGAMENWGLITFRESNLLYNPARDLRLRRQVVSTVIGHEIAHQWFGNLVTMQWWTDLWLNEGFAQYMGYVLSEEVDPEEPMETVFVQDNAFHALRLDSYSSTHAIITEAYDPTEILQLFDSITYKKGSCVVRMMANFLGPTAFRDALRLYLRTHAYGNAVSGDLWKAMDTVARTDQFASGRLRQLSVADVMENWVRVTGFPLVEITRNYSTIGTSIRATQSRFLLNGDDATFNKLDTWVVPFTYVSQSNPNWTNPKLVWLSRLSHSFDAEIDARDWMLANVNLQGFYRVNYDETNWRFLVNQLLTNHTALPVIQRGQLLDDAFELAKSGRLDVIMPLNISLYLVNESEYLPWYTFISVLNGLDSMLQNSSDYSLLRRYVQNLIGPTYSRIGWTETRGEDKFVIYLRHLMLKFACYFSLDDCLSKTHSFLQQWMQENSLEHIPISLRHLIACYGIQQSSSDREYEFIWKVFLTTTSQNDKLGLLMSLACTRSQRLLEKLLLETLHERQVRRWDLPHIINQLTMQSPTQRLIGWNFVKNNWDHFLNVLEDTAGRLSAIVEVFNDPEQLKDVEQFVRTSSMRGAARKFSEALETIRINVRWKQRDHAKVAQWLRTVVGG